MKIKDGIFSLADKLVVWLTRRRKIGLSLCATGVTLLIGVSASGFAVQFTIAGLVDSFQLKTSDGLPGYLPFVVVGVGLVMILVGLVLLLDEYWRERKESDISKVIVVELRGQVDTSDRPLKSAVPKRLAGHRYDCLIDIRRLLGNAPVDQRVASEALQELTQLQRRSRQERGDTAREHVSVVAGGVMQVPFLFYAGVLLDDEGQITLMDWERVVEDWKELAEPDSGERFSVLGMETWNGESEVVLAISATYKASADNIATTFPGLKVIQLALANPTPNVLFSEAMQAALTQQFIETMAKLANAGVQQVHLVLVASASLTLRFGRAYDARNMPILYCYHRDTEANPPYPWSIRMPLAGQPVQYVETVLDDTPA